MLLKNHLKDSYYKASLEKNNLLVENIITLWAHRFGVDSLNELLLQGKISKEDQEEENHEQINLIEEDQEEENHDQPNLELLDDIQNQEEINLKLCEPKKSNNNEIINKKTYAFKKSFNRSF